MAIASRLLQGHAPTDLAFLVFEDRVYFAHLSRQPHEPSSAVLRLIQGIYGVAPKIARLLLRQRIYSTAPTTELCHGAIKVSAKRIHAELPTTSETGTLTEDLHWINAGAAEIPTFRRPEPHPLSLWKKEKPPRSASDFLELAAILASQIPREGPLYRCDRNVAALLVSKTGEILSWGINTNASNRTLHAELNLIQDFFSRTQSPLPPGSKIFVTLKPCKMCAGAIWVAAEDPYRLEVYFTEFDFGRNARWTVLDVGSAERKNIARNAFEREAVLQHQTR